MKYLHLCARLACFLLFSHYSGEEVRVAAGGKTGGGEEELGGSGGERLPGLSGAGVSGLSGGDGPAYQDMAVQVSTELNNWSFSSPT